MVDVRTLTLRAWLLTRGKWVYSWKPQPLVDLDLARDRWVSDLAHELRTPLTSSVSGGNLQEQLEPPIRGGLIASCLKLTG